MSVNETTEMEIESVEANKSAFARSSMSVLELNNYIVSLRSSVRKCKQQVIQKLLRKIKLYRNKKGTEEQVIANNKKSERLMEEIKILKKVNLDKVSKYCLGNVLTIEKAAAKGTLNERVFTRVACHKTVLDKITKWRKEHDDWESLAAFALSKTTGRRFKNKKQTTSESGVDETRDLEVAKLKEFVDRVTGVGDSESGELQEAEDSSCGALPENSSSGKPVSPKSEGSSCETPPEEVSSGKPVSAKLNTRNTDVTNVKVSTVADVAIDNVEHVKLKVSAPKKPVADVIVKQITLDQLSDEELFLPPPLDNGGDDARDQTEPEAVADVEEDTFFAVDDESNDGDDQYGSTVREMESDDDREELPRKSENKSIDSSKRFGNSNFSKRRQDGGFRSNRDQRFSKKDFTKSRGHFPNTRGESYPKKFGDNSQGKFKANQREQNSSWKRETKSAWSKPGDYSNVHRSTKALPKSGQESSTKPPPVDEHLHPSWEASKRRKEQQKNLFAFQGTKKVFTDDD